MSLHRLSKYQLIAFLSSWCDLREITKLDTSICNKDERVKLLNIFQEFKHLNDFQCDETSYYLWLYTRNIGISSYCLGVAGVSMYSYLPNCSKIISLEISKISLENLKLKTIKLINLCKNLDCLTLNYVENLDYNQINSDIFASLTVLIIQCEHSQQSFEPNRIVPIIKHCKKLVKFSLKSKEDNSHKFVNFEELSKNNINTLVEVSLMNLKVASSAMTFISSN
jgi:hypothetical protein